MARLVVIGRGREFSGRPDRNGEVKTGVELFAMPVDAVSDPVRGFPVFKVPSDRQALFPRMGSVYDVTYREEYGDFGLRTVISDAVFVSAWSPELGCSGLA